MYRRRLLELLRLEVWLAPFDVKACFTKMLGVVRLSSTSKRLLHWIGVKATPVFLQGIAMRRWTQRVVETLTSPIALLELIIRVSLLVS